MVLHKVINMTICKSVALSALLFSVVYIFTQQFVGSNHDGDQHYTNVLLRAAVTTVGTTVAFTIFKWTMSHQNEMVLQIVVKARLARSSQEEPLAQSGGTTITAVQETLRADHEARSELVI